MRAVLAWFLPVILTGGCASAGARPQMAMVSESFAVPADPATLPSVVERGVRVADGLDVSKRNEAAVAPTERKVVYTAWFTVDVYDIREAQRALVGLADSLGGHMQETTGTAVVIRIPSGKFKEIEPALRKLGRVDDTATSIRAADITEEYYDLELRLATKKRYLSSLQKLLDGAGKLEEKLAVQREIAKVVEEIERVEGRLRLLSQQVALATVTVTFRLAHSGPKRTFRLPWGWLDRLGVENLVR